jgi:hypothetical protein
MNLTMESTVQPDVAALQRTSRVITSGSWFIIAGVVTYSLMVTTPFVAEHSPVGPWQYAAPILGLMMDVAFVMSLQADSVLAQHGVGELGPWPRAFRWLTGLGSLFLNVWSSVQHGDGTGVAIHALAPVLLLFLSEVGPVWRRAMAELIWGAEVAAAAAAEAAAPEPDPEADPVPEDETESEDADVTELFPVSDVRPPRQRRAPARAGSVMDRGLALMREAIDSGEDAPTTQDLADALGCTARHAQNIVRRWESA